MTSLSRSLPATTPCGEPLHAVVRPKAEADAAFGPWVRAVGRVHGAKRRRGVAVESADLGYGDEGEYVSDPVTGEPLALRVPAAARFPELAFVHALGRYVDQEHLGDGVAPASATDPAARRIVESALAAPSLAASVSFVEAQGRRLAERPPFPEDERDAWEREGHAEFLRRLSAREVFARAYAQYVAERVRPPALRLRIARRMTEAREAGTLPPFWEALEFGPIARLMHALLLEKGLIRLREGGDGGSA